MAMKGAQHRAQDELHASHQLAGALHFDCQACLQVALAMKGVPPGDPTLLMLAGSVTSEKTGMTRSASNVVPISKIEQVLDETGSLAALLIR